MSIQANRVHRRPALAASVRWSVASSYVGVTAGAWIATWFLELDRLFPGKVMLILGFGAALIVVLADKYGTSDSFGPANRVTLARAAMIAMLIALIGESPTSQSAWFAVIVASVVTTLDGVDGWLARSRVDASEFGARFDMETDALLIFTTTALAWRYGKAGPWILAGGLMRYAFIASSYLLPWMRRALPESQRRKTICVVQTCSLIGCLAPPLASPVSDVVALSSLVLLSGSFAIDIAWLARRT